MPSSRTTVEYHPDALKDYVDAIQWYLERDAGVAAAFRRELNRAVDQALDAPERWPMVAPGIRRVQFHRFPYALLYRLTPNAIRVVAVAHGRRQPGYWARRR